MTEEFDAVVIGSNIRGLVAAYLLSQLGYRAVLLERSARLGGADGSFKTSQGTLFDTGFHVLDYMRSPVTTRLFTHVLDGEVRRITLRRGIVLRGQLMPYAPAPVEMPAELRELLPGDELTDDIGDAVPTRERLGRCYGSGYADFVLDEVLPSFPAEDRHHQFGVDRSRLLTNVYPWFFPRASQTVPSQNESRAFHDRLRAGITQEILYPAEGGFGGFAAGFIEKLDRDRVDVRKGVGDINVEVDPATHRVKWAEAAGERISADHYFWGSGWAPLCELLGLPCQDVATDRVALGSFRLDRPPVTDFIEILVGDPRLLINRIHFPDELRGTDQNLMQIEFAFADADERFALEPDEWRDRWLADTRAIGLLDESHEVEEFDFKSIKMHFNGFGAEGKPLRDADPSLLNGASNLHPVAPSMANLNLNRYVPRALRQVSQVLTGLGAR